MIFTLNDKVKRNDYYKAQTHDALIAGLDEKKVTYNKDYSRNQSQDLFHVENNLTGNAAHQNYLHYLLHAWDAHYSIVVTPDIIWYSLLCELTGLVQKNIEKYRNLFSKSPDKQEISVQSGSMTLMPMDILIEALKTKVPTNTACFLPTFSTTNKRAEFARYAAFADMASPYYNYSMYCCGFPQIDVQGTKEDWQLILGNWKILTETFNSESKYFSKVNKVLTNLNDCLDDVDLWKDMFTLDQCGSGHQYYTKGWFTELFVDYPQVSFVENFASHVSVVKYKQLESGKNYVMKQGLFSSYEENNFLCPEFAHIVYEKTNEPKISKVSY